MKLKFSAAIVSLILALMLTPMTLAESTPEADKWLDKMMSAYTSGPLEADFTMTMDAAAMGMQGMDITAVGSGRMLMDSKSGKQKMDMVIKMDIPNMGEMKMSMKQVMSGDQIWMEMENPMMGGTMVMKMSKSAMETAAQQSGSPMGNMNSTGPLDAEQLEKMRTAFDWTVESTSGGGATLSAAMNREGMKALSGQDISEKEFQDIEKMGKMMLTLDSNGVPVEMKMGSFMSMTMSNIKRPRSFPEGTFDYTPPEGAQVMDLDQMMGAGQ